MRVTTKWDKTMTHYIGRPAVLRNPEPMKDDSIQERMRVIDWFETYARRNPGILATIKALPEDAVLGCYCAPKPCHGDVIVKLWKEMHNVR